MTTSGTFYTTKQLKQPPVNSSNTGTMIMSDQNTGVKTSL